MIKIDHIGIPACDAGASARALAAILGTGEPTVDGADGDMYRLDLDGGFLLFADSATFTPQHVAFLVAEEQFANIVAGLKQRGLGFGHDPENPRNGGTDDPHGVGQRVYWTDDNGHLFEASC
jgi:hypothetical protein